MRKNLVRGMKRGSEAKVRLVSRRSELAERMKVLRSSAESFRGFAPPDSADMAMEGAEDELVLRLMELRAEEIAEVEEAIERLGHGQYGICGHCGKKIPVMRLRLVPAARYCVECQNSMERELGDTEELYDWTGVHEGGGESHHSREISSVSGSKF